MDPSATSERRVPNLLQVVRDRHTTNSSENFGSQTPGPITGEGNRQNFLFLIVRRPTTRTSDRADDRKPGQQQIWQESIDRIAGLQHVIIQSNMTSDAELARQVIRNASEQTSQVRILYFGQQIGCLREQLVGTCFPALERIHALAKNGCRILGRLPPTMRDLNPLPGSKGAECRAPKRWQHRVRLQCVEAVCERLASADSQQLLLSELKELDDGLSIARLDRPASCDRAFAK